MDYKFQEKIQNNTISISIVYNNNEYSDAKKLKSLIENRYKNGLKTYKVKATLVSYQESNKLDANIYYLFPTNKRDIKEIIDQASHNSALTFSYNRDDLNYGVMISLNVAKKIKPLLNLEAIKTHNISLRPVLIDISTIFVKELDSSINRSKMRSFYIFKTYQA